jgi:AcrR family transcriptional regulator
MPEKFPLPEKTEDGLRDKHKAIIMAAREIFARQGYEATTIAEIAAQAKVAVGTVYLYFHNKREIYTATALDWIEQITAALLKPELLELPIKQVPRAIIETTFQVCRKEDQMMSLFQLDLQTQEEIESHQRAKKQVEQAIEDFLNHCITRGDFIPFDTKTYATMIFNIVHSTLFECFCLRAGASEERYRENTIEIIERLFFGPPLCG